MDAQRGIARRMVIGLPPEGLTPAWERDFAAYPPAGVIVFRRDFQDLEALRALTQRLRSLTHPRRLFVTIDEEGGFVSQLAGHWVVPPNARLLARGGQPGDVAWASEVTGRRLRAVGIEWCFAPVADVDSEPRNPVIGPRAFAPDPARAAAWVGEAVRGLRAAGAASCIKHFPGHGATELDSHHAEPVCPAPRDVLERRELVPFRANLDADAVMTTHVRFPALDPDRPATFSPRITRDLLRGELGFQGVTITDALEMKGAGASGGPLESARLALEAGCDLVLFAFHDEEVRRVRLELAKALVDERLDRTTFDAARPRLAALDRRCAEPSEAELAQPLERLTPPGWEERLERIVEAGLLVEGALPPEAARGPWRVVPVGASKADDVVRALAGQVPLGDEGVADLLVYSLRTPPDPATLAERVRAMRDRPAIVLALQNESILDELPEATLRIGASDATPLTLRVVARRLAAMQRAAVEARA